MGPRGRVTLPRRGGEEEAEEGEEQVGGSEMSKEEGGPDPAAAGGEDAARIHPGGSQVGVQPGLLGKCPRCETDLHNIGASSAGESGTRDPAEHSAASHPRRGNGGRSTGDGDNDVETGSSPKTKTTLKPSRRQRFRQPQQSQHSD